MKHLFRSVEKGQGLVEYALILVLVAIVVIAVLLTLGPVVSQAFSKVTVALMSGATGVITDVSAVRTGNGHGNDVIVTVTVSTNTSVTVSDSQNAAPVTQICNGSCTITLSGVGDAAGTASVTAAAGGSGSASYPIRS